MALQPLGLCTLSPGLNVVSDWLSDPKTGEKLRGLTC